MRLDSFSEFEESNTDLSVLEDKCNSRIHASSIHWFPKHRLAITKISVRHSRVDPFGGYQGAHGAVRSTHSSEE